jgi:cell division protein FtsI/penicillin-binding protein 2
MKEKNSAECKNDGDLADIFTSVDINASWKTYQKKIRKKAARKRLAKKLLKFFCILPLLGIILYTISGVIKMKPSINFSADKNLTKQTDRNTIKISSKADFHGIFQNIDFLNAESKIIPYRINEQPVNTISTLDPLLQNYLLNIMDISHAKNIGMIVMAPETGKIMAMVGYDKDNPKNNPCLDNRFPAASIFKIVTAAAAIEKFNFNSNSLVKYNGRKYTLYKSQLKDRNNKYTRTLSFEDSFAQSINPVFGKLGVFKLKKKYLSLYADAFGFNQEINFELQLLASRFTVSDTPFNWAEIACGFNKNTTLSPLHGALIVASVVNEGKIPEPCIVEKIIDKSGKEVYKSVSKFLYHPIQKKTAKTIYHMMQATVDFGTSRKAFRDCGKDRTLCHLNIGGKTGSIDNKSHDARIDWFIGFAEEKKGSEKMVISVMVAHGEYLGIRSSEYARMGIKRYFQNYFTKKNQQERTKTKEHDV